MNIEARKLWTRYAVCQFGSAATESAGPSLMPLFHFSLSQLVSHLCRLQFAERGGKHLTIIVLY
jgi:hypothetical protein